MPPAIYRSGPVKREKQAKRRSMLRSKPPTQSLDPVAVSGHCAVAVMGLQRARARR
jgi:hypothetical protein